MATRRPSPAQIAECLGGIDFPCSKNDLVNYARSHGCTDDRLTVLQSLPDRQFNSMADVMSGIGQVE